VSRAPISVPAARLVQKVLILALIGWQRFVSPLLGPRCKYHPSCSTYALGAVQHHGVLRGVPLAAWRVLRCNPFSDGGYDPVPERLGRPGSPGWRGPVDDPSVPSSPMSDDGGSDLQVADDLPRSVPLLSMTVPLAPMTPSAVTVTAAAGEAHP
jgi:putative membrane protein insertion efficiency factor